MVITTKGDILQAWFRRDGCLVHDKASDNPYGIDFAIGIDYTEQQKAAFYEICSLKKYLKATDYKAIKYAEGAISEAEFAPIKEARANARERINELTFPEPTLTRAEIDEAERLAMEKIKEARNANNQLAVCSNGSEPGSPCLTE